MPPIDQDTPQPGTAAARRTRRREFGPLEARVIELLWLQGTPLTVRDAVAVLPGLAYTTVMTTLERLHRKGLLLRERRGRAFVYAPRWSRAELARRDVSNHVAGLLASEDTTAAVLSAFVQSVGNHDRALLDELEALVQAERVRLQGRDR